jgi:hypothetical protein
LNGKGERERGREREREREEIDDRMKSGKGPDSE